MRQITVLAAVPPSGLLRLRSSAPQRYAYHPVRGWDEAVHAVRRLPIELGVVDPLLAGERGFAELERLRAWFPSLPLLVYTSLSPETANLLLALGRLGIRRALFARLDDTPDALRGALQEEFEQTVARQVLADMSDVLRDMPTHLRWVLQAALGANTRASSVGVLAEEVRVERRTCQRWLAKAGLPAPRTVLLIARLLYAHRLLRDPGFTVADVAFRLGYGAARTLQNQFRQVFGLTAGEMRSALSASDALEAVVARYFAPFRRAAS